MALVEVDRGNDGVATITLNRPEAMNALSRALQKELEAAIVNLSKDGSVRAIILTGSGRRAFSAGLDLKEVATLGLAFSAGLDSKEAATFSLATGADSEIGTNPVEAIANCPKPVIGAINGVAITGGFELALACDILIASANARFADTHARVGVIPGWGLSQILSRMIGIHRAKALSLTGNFIDATTAMAWGLVSSVVQPDALIATAKSLALDIASNDPVFIKRYKALITDGFALPFGEAMALEQQSSRDANSAVSAETVAKRRADIQSRGRTQVGLL